MSKKKPPVPQRPGYGVGQPSMPAPTPRPAAATQPVRSQPVRSAPLPPVARPSTPAASDLPLPYTPVVWWPLVVLGAIGVLLYVNTFGHQYALDDIAAIGQNLFVKQGLKGINDLMRTEFWHFSNISLGYYRPLSLITFALEQEYFGDKHPEYSHMINAALYGLTGVSLGALLQKWLPGKVVVAFLVGLVFITHPVHTEIVANIKGRDELLSFLFISLMLLTYWKQLESKAKFWYEGRKADWALGGLLTVFNVVGGWVIGSSLLVNSFGSTAGGVIGVLIMGALSTTWVGLSCAALYFAFLSKESSVVSLALIPAMQYWFGKRTVWRSLVSLWPLLIIAALFFYQKKQMIGTLVGTPPLDWANYPYAILDTKTSTMFKFFLYYLRLLVFPHPLVYDYSYNVIPTGGKGDIMSWLGFVALLGMIVLSWIGFRRRSLWGFGLFWFFVTMMPGLGFIASRGGILAERFLYASVMGFAFVLVWAVQALAERMGWSKEVGQPDDELISLIEVATPKPMLSRVMNYAPLALVIGLTTGLYSFKTVTRNPDWENNFVLFNSALPYAGTSCQVQRHVANEWIEKGLKERARIDTANVRMARYQTRPDSVKKYQAMLPEYNKEAGKYARWALDHLQESCRIYPNFGESYFSMAYVFQRITPNVDSAKYYYKQTIRAASSYAPAYNNLGVIYQNEGKYPLASYYYNKSMEVNPAYQDGKNNFAALKKATGLDVRFLPDSVITKN
ncbi:tetratricopeptide repeat protein [Fibrella aquatilis]|uniref:Tetratricopeptide repeat protein n=1 Tax=Fibrella aquatilis TaxID=2817059 RepID=A0A939G9G9_9BACT|nr:tetratricopeptide repeat protein [Fibrella aquatilis]MBO0934714.1 tetratricopeptide repeat protein [Fibrella aquatilis]